MKKPGNRKSDSNSHSNWMVVYHPKVMSTDIPRIAKTDKERIVKAIESKLMLDPLLYGLPLRATLKRYWKLRVADYRIVYTIISHEVRILIIAHRRNIYRVANKRIKN